MNEVGYVVYNPIKKLYLGKSGRRTKSFAQANIYSLVEAKKRVKDKIKEKEVDINQYIKYSVMFKNQEPFDSDNYNYEILEVKLTGNKVEYEAV